MRRKIDLDEIRSKNPNLDWDSLAQWQRLRRTLVDRGTQGRRVFHPVQGKRAQVVDDPESDPRLLILHRI
jgi:hypothetical protein